jgi:dienelactone hydrolase
MKTTLKRIHTSDNVELVGLLYEPDIKTEKVLVHVHGMAGNFYENKFLDSIADMLTKNGIAFFVFNNRGTEFIKDMYKVEEGKRSVVRLGDSYEKFEDCLFDIKAGIDAVASWGFSTIHLSGHSLAGPKVAYYAAEGNDNRISSVIFLSPADMVGIAKKDKDFERDISTARKMVAEGKGNDIMPFDIWGDCILSANSYLSVTDESGAVAIFNFYNPELGFATLGKIKIPSLTILGKKDHVVIIPIEQMMAKIKETMVSSPKVDTVILGEADHAYNNYEQQLADTITQWLLGK